MTWRLTVTKCWYWSWCKINLKTISKYHISFPRFCDFMSAVSRTRTCVSYYYKTDNRLDSPSGISRWFVIVAVKNAQYCSSLFQNLWCNLGFLCVLFSMILMLMHFNQRRLNVCCYYVMTHPKSVVITDDMIHFCDWKKHEIQERLNRISTVTVAGCMHY